MQRIAVSKVRRRANHFADKCLRQARWKLTIKPLRHNSRRFSRSANTSERSRTFKQTPHLDASLNLAVHLTYVQWSHIQSSKQSFRRKPLRLSINLQHCNTCAVHSNHRNYLRRKSTADETTSHLLHSAGERGKSHFPPCFKLDEACWRAGGDDPSKRQRMFAKLTRLHDSAGYSSNKNHERSNEDVKANSEQEEQSRRQRQCRRKYKWNKQNQTATWLRPRRYVCGNTPVSSRMRPAAARSSSTSSNELLLLTRHWKRRRKSLKERRSG